MTPRPHRKLVFDFAFATCLISLSVAIVVLWLLMALLALNHVLDPWSNAGVLLYGLGFIFLAAIFGVPGSAWARSLSEEFELPRSRRARVTARIGSLSLALGAPSRWAFWSRRWRDSRRPVPVLRKRRLWVGCWNANRSAERLHAYLEGTGVAEGFTEALPGYFALWHPDEIEMSHGDLQVATYAPGFLGFGTDGGGELLEFDGSGAVFMLPMIGMEA